MAVRRDPSQAYRATGTDIDVLILQGTIMKFLAKAAAALAFAAVISAPGAASAANSSATLTADNGFWLYSGNATGSNLSFVGTGDSWPTAYSFSFDVSPGDYLYVLAIDSGPPHSWQGVFNTPDGTIYSDASSWVAYNVTTPLNAANPVNSALIASATFGPVGSELPHNSGPWNSVVGNVNAKWIWSTGPNSSDTLVLFRTTNVAYAVPEPETYAMLLAGVAVLGVVVRRRKVAAA